MKKRLWILVLISSVFTLYLVTDTLALFESSTEEDVANLDPARWTIKLNNTDISKGTATPLSITSLHYTNNENVEEDYIAPGLNGYFTLELDATNTDVAVKFDITFEKDKMNYSDNITFNVTQETDNINTIKTGENTYTGVLSLADIKNGEGKVVFKINISWLDPTSGEYDESDTILGKKMYQSINIPVVVHAEQYTGETITPYVG